MSFYQHALAHAARGFRVFPLQPGAKLPAIDDFPNQATTDPEIIKSWWVEDVMGWEHPYNIGISTDGLCVIDVDVKDGRKGDASLLKLQLEGLDLPTTYEQTTPTAGGHLVFSASKPVSNSVQKIGAGLDVRGQGGFIVASGSTTPKGVYRDNGLPIADAPPELLVRCGFAKERAELSSEAAASIDEDRASARFAEWLKTAPRSEKGNGGDACAYNTACKGRDFGCSEATVVDLMLSEAWEHGCGWSAEKLERKVAHAFKYAKGVPGNAAAELEFGPLPAHVFAVAAAAETLRAVPAAKRKLYSLAFNEIGLDEEARPLVKGLLEQGAASVVYGDSNTGKSFVVLDMCLHVAMGWPYRGRKVARGAVLFVAAEGGTGAQKRFAALRKHYQLDGADVPLYLVPCPVNLRDPAADTGPLIDLAREAEKTSGLPVVLIVIDTLARAMAGGDENGAADMGAFIAAVDELRAALGSHVLSIHHTGKDQSKGARGHSSLRAAMDSELRVADGVVTVTKARDSERAQAMPFKLHVVHLGMDADGDPITSCVAVASGAADFFENADEHAVVLRKIRAYLRQGAMVSGRDLERTQGGSAGCSEYPCRVCGKSCGPLSSPASCGKSRAVAIAVVISRCRSLRSDKADGPDASRAQVARRFTCAVVRASCANV